MKPFLCAGDLLDKTLKPVVMISDCIECVVEEELNGKYECTLKLPVGSVFFRNIKSSLEGNKDIYIYAKANPDTEMQYFRVYQASEALSGTASIHCEHIRYILNRLPCPMIHGRNAKAFLNSIRNNISYCSKFPFFMDSNIEYDREFSVDSVRTIGEMENHIAEYFGGEWQFTNYTAMLWKKRGTDRNIVLQHGYDLSSVKNDVAISTAYTHVFPYYSWSVEDGTIYTVTLTHKSLESRQPMITKRDLIQIDLSFNEETDTPRIYAVNLAEYTNIDITAGFWNGLDIRSMAESWVDDNKASLLGVDVNCSITTAELQKNTALQRCRLGDTIRVRVPKMGIEAKTRIVSYKYDSILECYTDLEVGKIQQKLSNTIAKLNADLKKTNSAVSMIQSQTSSALTSTYTELSSKMQSNYDDLLKLINNTGKAAMLVDTFNYTVDPQINITPTQYEEGEI